MTASLERKVLGEVLNDYATANNLAVHWPNRDFAPPQKDRWLRFSIRSGDGRQVEMGSPQTTYRYPGVLMLQVFVPANSGDRVARDLAEALADLYRREVLTFSDGQVRLKTPTIRDVGPDGAWYQMNVVVPFDRENYQ